MNNDKKLKEILGRFGIELYGIVNDSKPSTYPSFLAWVNRGDHGELGYLADHRKDKREDIRNYFPDFAQALVMSFDYSKSSKILQEFYQSPESNGAKIASYVMGFDGIDYHFYLRDKLQKIADEIKALDSDLDIQFTLDTQPVLERDLAHKAGLGWFGKNSMLINKSKGSFFIIGSLLLSKKLFHQTHSVDTDHCGNCTKCIDLCPTDAIDVQNRTIFADKCISTFTIELFKDAEPPIGIEKSGGEIYGCDICQDVCPWNIKLLKNLEVTDEERVEFSSKNKDVIEMFLKRPIKDIVETLNNMSNRQYKKKLAASPIARTGRVGMLKNLMSFLRR